MSFTQLFINGSLIKNMFVHKDFNRDYNTYFFREKNTSVCIEILIASLIPIIIPIIIAGENNTEKNTSMHTAHSI
jgi:hypothetical protein